MFFKSKVISLVLILSLCSSGCIRLFGKAGYYKETPETIQTRVVGFDTAKIMEDRQTRGSITA